MICKKIRSRDQRGSSCDFLYKCEEVVYFFLRHEDAGMRVCRGRRDMFIKMVVGLLVMLLGLSWRCEATELMFELPDRDRQCFYEEIEKGISCTLEYQVKTNKQTNSHTFLIKAHHTYLLLYIPLRSYLEGIMMLMWYCMAQTNVCSMKARGSSISQSILIRLKLALTIIASATSSRVSLIRSCTLTSRWGTRLPSHQTSGLTTPR